VDAPGKALADWPAPGEADLMKFAGKLMPILKSLGFPDISPQVIPAHNFVMS
jgi:hypothetical protein